MRDLQRAVAHEHSDRVENGTISTLAEVRIVERTFDDLDTARDYALRHAENTSDAIAVKARRIKTTRPLAHRGPFALASGSLWTCDGTSVRPVVVLCDEVQGRREATKLLRVVQAYVDADAPLREAERAAHGLAGGFTRGEPLTSAWVQQARRAQVALAKARRARDEATARYAAYHDALADKLFPITAVEESVVWVVGGWAAW
ncbi:MAG: hypothetical protein K2R93_03825 [Gemmatimonadaceae bacterium]|nr:hypothetical protein [Gemmatimonadaceae bacterium]